MKDTIVGKVQIHKNKDGEPTKLFDLIIYQWNKSTGEPIQDGVFKYTDKKTKEQKETPNYKLLTILSLPISTCGDVAVGKKKSAAIFLKQKY